MERERVRRPKKCLNETRGVALLESLFCEFLTFSISCLIAMEEEKRILPVKIPTSSEAFIVSMGVAEGERVRKGSILCSYRCDNSATCATLKSPCVGVVHRVQAEKMETISPG